VATPSAPPSTSPWPEADQIWNASERTLEMVHTVLKSAEAPVGETPKDLIWRKNKAHLYRYRRETPATHATPILLVLPLINRAYILDLRPGSSFVQFLLANGFDVFMLDWGIPGEEDRNLSLDVLMEQYLPRAVRKASQAAGGVELTMLGYCIGGTLAACFAAMYPDAPVNNLVLFTTPIDFADAGRLGTWTAGDAFPIDQLAEVFPTIPGSLPDLGSKMLNPLPNTIGAYVRLWHKLGDPTFDPAGWQAMYRWVNEGVPFPSAAYRQWIKEFYQGNKLVKGTLQLAGRPVRLENIRIPLLNVSATNDAIAPRTTTAAIVNLVSTTDTEEVILKGGHVGVVVGRAANRDLWPRVAEWLGRHDGPRAS